MFEIKRTQKLSISIEDAWEFFSSPHNLKDITPDYLGFEIQGNLPSKMIEGLEIEYKIKPVFRIPMRWRSQLTDIHPPYSFVDTQLSGPYKYWEHTHKFEKNNGFTIVHDIVKYSLPLGIIGEIVHALYIKNKLKKVFNYRQQRLEDLFKNNEQHVG